MPFLKKSNVDWYNAGPLEIIMLSIPGFSIVMYFILYKKLSSKERILLLPVVILYSVIAAECIRHFFK